MSFLKLHQVTKDITIYFLDPISKIILSQQKNKLKKKVKLLAYHDTAVTFIFHLDDTGRYSYSDLTSIPIDPFSGTRTIIIKCKYCKQYLYLTIQHTHKSFFCSSDNNLLCYYHYKKPPEGTINRSGYETCCLC